MDGQPEGDGKARRQSTALSLGGIALRGDAKRTIRQQLYDAIRDAILAGRLAPGGLLLSSRLIAAEFRVSRNTASIVYERLLSEGLVETTVGSGTRVTQSIPPEFFMLVRARAELRARRPGTRNQSLRGWRCLRGS
jgi:GntR family transcriptional regulator/MocR family aminotransferase